MDEKEVEIDIVEEEGPKIIYEGEEGYEEKAELPDDNEESEYEALDSAAIEENIKADLPAKKPRIPAKTRINQITRKAHEEARRAEKAERELLAIREENERLRRQYESSNEAVINSQENMLDSHVRNAEQVLAKAIEDGDIQAQIEANKALASAIAHKNRLDEYKYQQKIAKDEHKIVAERKVEPIQNYEEAPTPEAMDWLAENSWFDPDSDDFDPDLHQKAVIYDNYLKQKYLRNGREDLISSHAYFDDIDRYMNRFTNRRQPVQETQRQQNPRGELSMNKPRGTVSGVGHTPMQGGRETFRMSRDEQDMARAMGWSDQQWFHYKKEAERLERQERLRTGSGNGQIR